MNPPRTVPNRLMKEIIPKYLPALSLLESFPVMMFTDVIFIPALNHNNDVINNKLKNPTWNPNKKISKAVNVTLLDKNTLWSIKFENIFPVSKEPNNNIVYTTVMNSPVTVLLTPVLSTIKGNMGSNPWAMDLNTKENIVKDVSLFKLKSI